MAEINLSHIVKDYGRQRAVHGIDLDIKDGEFVVLVGPSGCGKSTTLRMIAGLEKISDGEIMIGKRIINDLPPRERNISMVFQNYALYPHMTVRENLGFSLVIAKRDESVIERQVAEAATILGLEDLMDRKPAQLSGGQRQRVAMGRAIVRHPDAFLFDEPLSNLDAKLRTQMRVEIKKLHQKLNTTIVYVTHDQVEAMTLADRIVLMRDGHIVQVGTPLELFNSPVDTFVATFIGSPPMNILPGEIISGNRVKLSPDVTLPLPKHVIGHVDEGQHVQFGFRADNLMPDGHAVQEDGKIAKLSLPVTLTEPLGTETLLFAELAGQEIQAKMLNPRPVAAGEVLPFGMMIDKCLIFDGASQKSIGAR